MLFPAAWTDPNFEDVLPAGTPVAQCFPVARRSFGLGLRRLSPDRAQAYDATANALLATPGVYRKNYRDKRPSLRQMSA